MKIAYVARHGDHGNNDEQAIAHALTQLGHEVLPVHEADALAAPSLIPDADFLLFHKWTGASAKTRMPKVFWFFDQVAEQEDARGTKLEVWTAQRRAWMARTMEHVLVGFCTDGDWVAQDRTGKLAWLTQGFDERWAGKGRKEGPAPEIAFFGTATRNGVRRRRCLEFLRERYGDRLWVLNKEAQAPIHGQALADLCVSAKVIVAPDGPCTDRYWSNRVYLVTGLGGCLVHPVLDGLDDEYPDDELAVYHDYEGHEGSLSSWVDRLLENPYLNFDTRLAGHNATMQRHTYRHRCEALVEEVRRRLK